LDMNFQYLIRFIRVNSSIIGPCSFISTSSSILDCMKAPGISMLLVVPGCQWLKWGIVLWWIQWESSFPLWFSIDVAFCHQHSLLLWFIHIFSVSDTLSNIEHFLLGKVTPVDGFNNVLVILLFQFIHNCISACLPKSFEASFNGHLFCYIKQT